LTHECNGEGHRLAGYGPAEGRLQRLVASFNRRLVAAAEAGRDVSKVLASLDPDPARYTDVSEGGGAVETMLAEAEEALASAPAMAGFGRVSSRRLPTALPAARPAVAAGPDGSLLVAWIEWDEKEGERVLSVELDCRGELRAEPQAVSGAAGDCLRPSVAYDGAGRPHVFFGLRKGGEVGVFLAVSTGGAFGQAQLLSTTAHPSFNQEVARRSDGSLECCWQGYAGGRFAIFSRAQRSGGFGDTRLLSGDDERNVWDPAVAADGEGNVSYAWTSYGEGGYTTSLLVRRRGEGPFRARLSSPAAYSLHPSLLLAADGSVLCAQDSVRLGGHGGSGPTGLRLREQLGRPLRSGTRPDGRVVPGDLSPDVEAEVVLLGIGDGPSAIEQIGQFGGSLLVSPAGLPRLVEVADPQATAPGRRLAVAYRCLRRLPLMLYYWETVLEWHDGSLAQPLTVFEDGDGPLEEPSAVAFGGEVVVCWQGDGRKERELGWTEGFGGEERAELRRHYGEVVWHSVHRGGEVRLAKVAPPPSRPGASLQTAGGGRILVHEPPEEARPFVAARRGPPPERYSTEVSGRRYQLFWGDLHRHSLVSRCTAGDEPELDDFYRYSFDVCEYDFWAVTDHAENTSAYQWWQMQKLADILNVPGRFVPFYGFEWTAATGHQNVIYESARRPAPIYSSTAALSSRPDQLWARLRGAGQRCLTIPHHPGSAMVPFDWGYGDEEMLRLVEIFQACRGNYEEDGCFRQYSDGTLLGTFVADGLRAGHRFGLIASSDHGNGASYVGAFAAGLSRGEIFEALYERRTMAASTRDIVIDFRLNDSFMGECAPPAEIAAVTATAEGYSDLALLEVVRDGAVVCRIAPQIDLEEGSLALPLRIEWASGETDFTDWSGQLQLSEGEVLETRFVSPEIVDVSGGAVSWVATTRNFRSQYGVQRGGVEITVIGPPTAVLKVTTATCSGAARLGDLAERGTVELGSGQSGTLRLRRGTGGLLSLGSRRATLSFEDPVEKESFYYARAILEDGEMAWSSPVFIKSPDAG
jgi:hypothetical protein